jgi:hypothetical protein
MRIVNIFSKFHNISLSSDHRRNLKVLIIASLLNISFAIEKILLSNDINLGDPFWAFVYGSLAVYTTYVATIDYIFDVVEDSERPGDHLTHRISPTV